MTDQTTPSLQELNRYLFAAMMPDTHFAKAKGRVKATTAKDTAAVEELRNAGLTKDAPFSPEQLDALAKAGVFDPANAAPEAVAAVLNPPQAAEQTAG